MWSAVTTIWWSLRRKEAWGLARWLPVLSLWCWVAMAAGSLGAPDEGIDEYGRGGQPPGKGSSSSIQKPEQALWRLMFSASSFCPLAQCWIVQIQLGWVWWHYSFVLKKIQKVRKAQKRMKAKWMSRNTKRKQHKIIVLQKEASCEKHLGIFHSLLFGSIRLDVLDIQYINRQTRVTYRYSSSLTKK